MIQRRVCAGLAAKLFRGCADPTRLAVLLALLDGERRVVDLMAEVGGSRANISGHPACLKDCGLVTSRPQGRASYYRIARPEVRQLLESAEALLAAVGHRVTLCPATPGRARTWPPAAARTRRGTAGLRSRVGVLDQVDQLEELIDTICAQIRPGRPHQDGAPVWLPPTTQGAERAWDVPPPVVREIRDLLIQNGRW